MHRRRPARATRASRRAPLPVRHRRALAAALAALTAGGTAYLALDRPAHDAVPALVAARALPVGHLLTDADLQVRDLPAAAVPTDALTRPVTALNRRVVAPLAQGEVITSVDLRTSSLLVGQADGAVAVFLPLSEPAVTAAVEPADLVDVHSPVDGSLVLTGALVLRTEGPDRPGLWLAVDRPGAQALAAARGADPAGAWLQVALHAQQ